MPTVDVRITSMYPPGEVGSIRGYASATIDSCLAIRGIKVMDGGERGLFISMPSRKTTEGYKEVCFPVTAEFREQLHNAVLSGAGTVCGPSDRCSPARNTGTGGGTAQPADVGCRESCFSFCCWPPPLWI